MRPGRLDHVRVDGALREEAHAAQALRLVVEDIDEGAADDLALGLGIGHPGERREEARLGIDAHYAYAEVPRKGTHHLLGFAETQQPMIDEHARELIADRALQERSYHRGVHPARETEQDLVRPYLRARALDGVREDVACAPQRVRAADLAHEALEQARPLRGVGDLRVKLHAIEAAPLIAHRGERDGAGAGGGDESRRQLIDPVTVTHPDIEDAATGGVAAVLEVIKQPRGAGNRHLGVAELALARGGDAAAELLRHGLHAVADAEHRHAELEHRGRRVRRVGGGDRFRPAGENHATRGKGTHLRVADVPRVDLTVDAELAHAPGDELRVLRAEIQDQDAMRVDVEVRRRPWGHARCSSGNARHRDRFRTPGSWVPPW